jgi:hypothetical protein
MLRKNNFRRPLAVLLMIAGALVMSLTPESRAGMSLLALALAVEVVGIALRRK